jgi:multiple sugar transport system permease protein
MPSVVLMTLWWTVGAPAVILLAGLKQIPRHYYEAAALDGATSWQRFRHITLPLLRPVLLFVLVMNTIGSFQVFGQTFMMTRGGPELTTRVLVQYIYETAFNFYRMGYGAAMSWLLFVVIAVFAAVQFRIMRER